MDQDLFFKGEIPALESDQEGKLRGGFCALGGGIDLLSNSGCTDTGCGHINKGCTNKCGSGSGVTNQGCTNNTCAPGSSDENAGCTNDCGTVDTGCSHQKDDQCTTPVNNQKVNGLSFFNLGTSALF